MSKSIGTEFMLKTRYAVQPTPAQDKGIPQPAIVLPLPPDAKLIHLPDPLNLNTPAMDVQTAINQRRTLRKYADPPLSMEELSLLLWVTQGVQRVTDRPVTFRTVPSAGARHAFETYLLVNRVEGLTAGLYRYAALEHALFMVNSLPDIAAELRHACLDQNQITGSAVSFFWVAVVERMTWRYSQRGYRYLHLDAGHVCQNLYQAAETINCGVCAIAAFDDDLLNAALKLDGENLFAIYAGSVGKKG